LQHEDIMSELHRQSWINRREASRILIASAAFTAAAGILGPLRKRALAAAVIPCGSECRSEKGILNMTQDLAKLSAEHFEQLIGKTFTIGEYLLKLRDVQRRPNTASHFRQQFSLTFEIPRDLPIRSDVMAVQHPAIGEHHLLVTQVIDNIDETALEICFA
jgi:hypothetical protein